MSGVAWVDILAGAMGAGKTEAALFAPWPKLD